MKVKDKPARAFVSKSCDPTWLKWAFVPPRGTSKWVNTEAEAQRLVDAYNAEHAPKREVTVNAEQRLFVIPCGDGGCTAFGFDNCFRDATHLAKLLDLTPPSPEAVGTLNQYQFYRQLCARYAARPDLNRQTWFTPGTPLAVQAILEKAWQSRGRFRLFLGDRETGEPWLGEHAVVGTISRSLGPQRVPLLIPNARSTGGGAILTDFIVAILDAGTGQTLYQHPGFEYPTFELRDQDNASACGGVPYEAWYGGECVARFATAGQRARYIAFQRGERFSR